MNTIYLPHAVCLRADPALIRLLVVGNLLVALAYMLIPAAIFFAISELSQCESLWQSLLQKRILIGGLFICFIFSCGLTHILSVVVLFRPMYWLEGLVVLATGIISMVTAAILFWVACRGSRA